MDLKGKCECKNSEMKSGIHRVKLWKTTTFSRENFFRGGGLEKGEFRRKKVIWLWHWQNDLRLENWPRMGTFLLFIGIFYIPPPFATCFPLYVSVILYIFCTSVARPRHGASLVATSLGTDRICRCLLRWEDSSPRLQHCTVVKCSPSEPPGPLATLLDILKKEEGGEWSNKQHFSRLPSFRWIVDQILL